MRFVSAHEGAPVILYGKNGLRPWDPITERLWAIAPLLESQPYIDSVRAWNGEAIDYDACFFRDDGLPFGETLARRQAEWLKLKPDFSEPWLTAPLHHSHIYPSTSGHIVINRSARYHNYFFPWRELVEAFSDKIIFIGLPSEYDAFCKEFGRVDYLQTKSLLEAAQAIAESELFIGNQSSCNALAEGLKHPLIQETDLSSPDCIYPRENAIHCHNGELNFTVCGQHFASKNRMFVRAHRNETPPGGWKVEVGEYQANSYAFDLVTIEITRKLSAGGREVPMNLHELIIEQNSTAHHDHPVARLKARLRSA
jgi:hypothetical protein